MSLEIICKAADGDEYGDLFGFREETEADKKVAECIKRTWFGIGDDFWLTEIPGLHFSLRVDCTPKQQDGPGPEGIGRAYYGGGPGVLFPLLLHDVLLAVVTSGATTAVYAALYKVLKLWVDARNGRKLRIRIGDVEVEATQIPEKDVVKIFELLQEKANSDRIRAILLAAETSDQNREDS